MFIILELYLFSDEIKMDLHPCMKSMFDYREALLHGNLLALESCQCLRWSSFLSLTTRLSHYKRYLMKKCSRYSLTLVVIYANIRLSKELDYILMMPKSGHFSDVVLIQSQRAWGCLCLRLLHRLPFCLQKVCHRPIAAESSVFSVRFC